MGGAEAGVDVEVVVVVVFVLVVGIDSRTGFEYIDHF
jgi:hypothetical protein